MLDPEAVGATSEPTLVEWSTTDTLLYALGVGAGTEELQFTTENSHGVTQQVLPTYAVLASSDLTILSAVGKIDWGKLLHGAQAFTIHRPLQPSGSLMVTSDVVDLQDKGAGKNAVVKIRCRGVEPVSGELVTETLTTLVLRDAGGFGGSPGIPEPKVDIPEGKPDTRITLSTSETQALLYRLSGDRNPLHSDPWFARERAGFAKPILHGLCSFGVAGRALVQHLCDGDADRLTSMSARFSAPVFPGESLSTSIWHVGPEEAVFQTSATTAGEAERIVLTAGKVAFTRASAAAG